MRNLPADWDGVRPQDEAVDWVEKCLSALPFSYHDGVDVGVIPEDGGIELVWPSRGLLCSFYADREYHFVFIPDRGANISTSGVIDSDVATKLLQFLDEHWSSDIVKRAGQSLF